MAFNAKDEGGFHKSHTNGRQISVSDRGKWILRRLGKVNFTAGNPTFESI
jgi:hypothetical protein